MPPVKKCETCSATFVSYKGRNRRFCSRKCYEMFRGQKKCRLTKPCKICGKVFEYWKYRRNAKFCSHKCCWIDKQETAVGEGNPAWLGGFSLEPYGPGFNEKLKKVIRSTGNKKCLHCGVSQGSLSYSLHVHHINYNKRDHCMTNLVPLCQPCHGITQANRKFWTVYYSHLVVREG